MPELAVFLTSTHIMGGVSRVSAIQVDFSSISLVCVCCTLVQLISDLGHTRKVTAAIRNVEEAKVRQRSNQICVSECREMWGKHSQIKF